jgi:acyl carrier protein phosphodiesterase
MLKIRNGKALYLYIIIPGSSVNYLAHAYLSFNHPDILVGNMISDFVKGKKQFDYPLAVQKGIVLHRVIDAFTDAHAATKKLKSFFQPEYRLYSGAFADVVYDYFLANDTNSFATPADLESLCTITYRVLEENHAILPDQYKKILPVMKEQNWLFNYRYPGGIEKSFGGLVRRAAYLKESGIAFELFNRHLLEMQVCYDDFFPEVKKISARWIDDILKH